MKGYYFKKILSALMVLFIIITLNFFLPRMIFSDPAQPYFVGVPEDAVALRNQIREEYGFNDPIYVQYLDYLGRVLTLDFGQSHYYKESVWTVMFSRIPWSMVLTVSSMLFSILFGIIFGAAAGRKRDRAADKVLLWLSGVTTAIPSFWLAMVAVMLFGFTLKLFPYRGAMTPGDTLVMDGTLFAIALGVCLILAVVLRIVTKKSVFMFAGIPASLLIALLVSVPFADIADVAYHAALPVGISVFSGVISYTKALIDTIPSLDEKVERFVQIPHPMHKQDGCYFSNRCGYCTKLCRKQMPPLFDRGGGRKVRCYYDTEALWEKSF